MLAKIFGKNFRSLAAASVLAMSAAFCAPAADAATVRGVHVTKGQGWVRVTVDAPGASYSIKLLPVGTSAYRSLAIDIPGSSIAGGLEPKNKVAVNQGLVGQVRVTQLGSTVRIYVDVIAYPKYKVANSGGRIVLGIDSAHMIDQRTR